MERGEPSQRPRRPKGRELWPRPYKLTGIYGSGVSSGRARRRRFICRARRGKQGFCRETKHLALRLPAKKCNEVQRSPKTAVSSAAGGSACGHCAYACLCRTPARWAPDAGAITVQTYCNERTITIQEADKQTSCRGSSPGDRLDREMLQYDRVNSRPWVRRTPHIRPGRGSGQSRGSAASRRRCSAASGSGCSGCPAPCRCRPVPR